MNLKEARKNEGKLGVPFEVWLERWKGQYDDIPSLEQIKWSYPDIPERLIYYFLERVWGD